MKKIILLTFIGSLFAAVSAFGHCGTCGTGDKAHDHATEAKECAEPCEKACCAKKEKAKECAEPCEKACCTKKEKAADETAAAPEAKGACCPTKASQPA